MMEYYASIIKIKSLAFATKWLELTYIMLREINNGDSERYML